MRTAGVAKPMALLLAWVLACLGCAHAPPPERKVYVIHANASAHGLEPAAGTGGSGAEAYCNELQKQCYTACWRRKPELDSIKKHSEKHREHCSSKCLEVFMTCVKEQEGLERQEAQKRELQFQNMDAALDWLRSHTAAAPPGTNVVVAGTLFVVALVAGALVLAPL